MLLAKLVRAGMYLKAAGCLPSQVLSESQQTSVVPFLYQTRTLVGLPAGAPYTARRSTGRFRRDLSSTKEYRASYKPREPDSDIPQRGGDEHSSFPARWSLASQRGGPYQEKSPQWSSDIKRRIHESEPPEDAYKWSSRFQRPSQLQESKAFNSTITVSEKAVFDRIFNEISKNAMEKDKARAREEDELEFLEDDATGEEDVSGDPRAQLASIFNIAITRQEERKQKASIQNHRRTFNVMNHTNKRAIDSSPGDLGRATFEQKGAFNRSDLDQDLPTADEEHQVALKRTSDEHRRSVDSLLDAANTDVEIWAVLEKEVFSLIAELNLQTKREEKERKVALRRQKKAAKLALINKNNYKPIETLEDASSDATEKLYQPLSTTSESKPETTNPLLTLIQSTYAHHCLHALRLFRDLGLSSPYALHLLPHIKSLGPVSYVLGATIDVYNEILFQKWTQFSDVQGMADLMEEMINQGISANITTLEFLRFVDRSRRLDLRGENNGGAKSTWWHLRPIREGWKRVKTLYVHFMDELGEVAKWDRDEMKLQRRELVVRKLVTKTSPLKKVPLTRIGSLVMSDR